VIPSNVPHGVIALEDTVVFDIFAPKRDDWPR
jgi:quercetin dioxygenase-like cupin family protein